MEREGFNITGRIWISRGNATFLGEGRIELLCSIQETGSISKAAKLMGMSYKKAWELVSSMNTSYPSPLVIVATGGLNGGGSLLSDVGKELVRVFKELEQNNRLFLQKELEKIKLLQ